MAACAPVLDLAVGYKKRKLSDHDDTPLYSQNKVQRVEHEEFCSMSEVTETSLSQQVVRDPTNLTHAASYLELDDNLTVQDQNQLHLVETFLFDFSSFDEISSDHDSSSAPLPSSDEDNGVISIATTLVQPHFLTNPTALVEWKNDIEPVLDETQLDYGLDIKELADFFLNDGLSSTKFDNNVISVINLLDDDDDDNDDEVCSVINLEDDDDDEANSVLQKSFTTVQTIQSTNEDKESSVKGNNDVQPGPEMIESSLLDCSIDSQMQHGANDQERIYDDTHDSHTLGISDDFDYMKLIGFEKLDFYEDEFDLIRLGCDALESPAADSLVDASFPCLQKPAVEVKESNGIKVVMID